MGELTPASAGPLRVLLVDDDAEMRAIGRMGLALDGRMDVVVASSGEEGAELARVERPDVILLDALMPGLDGLGTVKVLRQHEFTAETPIIFLTATSEPDELRRLRDADVAGIIAKPFSPKSLAPLVRGLLEKFLASRNPVPGKRILIVEDDDELADLLVTLLRERKFHVTKANSYETGLKVGLEGAWDLAIVDAVLGDGDGTQLLEQLHQALPSRALILMSAFLSDARDLLSTARRLSLAAVISKPFALEQFLVQVASALEPHGGTARPEETVSEDAHQVELDQMRTDYRATLVERLADLGKALSTAKRGGDEALEAAFRLSHRIHGTAGTYGFERASRAAGAIELALRDLMGRRTEAQRVPWVELERVLSQATYALLPEQDTPDAAGKASTGAGAAGPIGRVLLVTQNNAFAERISRLGRARMFAVSSAISGEHALAIVRAQPVDALFVDLDLEGESPYAIVKRLRAMDDMESLPVGFLSADDSVATRVAAAHAGASVFASTTDDDESMLSSVRRLLDLVHHDEPRVLLVEDDPDFSSFLSATLSSSGMRVHAVDDPMALMGAMESHRPDVVLLDVSLPQVSGLDLCRLLRAQPSYQDLPILFVTANTSAEMRIACFKAGADDYVTKPISREELLARIRGRHERARMARARAERDPLTGLLLRRAFADAFERSIAQARRSSTGLAVAILDLDHFKKVNDRYGHTMGDTVLATFARMFRARLRTEDIRGRWGGEEFIVALQGLDAQTAAKVIVRSMEEFQRVSFRQGAEAFNVTFSSGIASFPDDGDSLEELVKVADRRLYRAKEEGRAQACAKG